MKRAITLDIDNTLLYCMDANKKTDALYNAIQEDPDKYDLKCRFYLLETPDIVTEPGTGEMERMYCIERPYLSEFLTFVRNYFDYVIIWSAAKPRYIRYLTDRFCRDLVSNTGKGVDFVLGYGDTAKDGANGNFCKPLSLVSEKIPFIRPEHILIVDDKIDNFTVCNINNGIGIPAFEPDATLKSLRQQDIALKQIMQWLDSPEVKASNDYRIIDKSKIFTTAI